MTDTDVNNINKNYNFSRLGFGIIWVNNFPTVLNINQWLLKPYFISNFCMLATVTSFTAAICVSTLL